MRRPLHLLLAAVLVPLGPLAWFRATPALAEVNDTPRGSIGIRLLDAAVSRSQNPRARLYIEDHVTPGTTVARHVLVTNNTGRTQTVSVYPGPAKINRGAFIGDEAGARSELTTWTRISERSLLLRQGEGRRLTVQVTVPGYASRSERYGVVWASISSGSTDQDGVRMVNRVGVRMYLDVGAGGEDPSRFSISDLIARRSQTGVPTVQAAIRNTGGRALDLSGTLMLTGGPGGLRAGPFTVRTPTTLAPGQRGRVSLALDNRVPDGPWRARIALHSGLVKGAATGRITFPGAGGRARASMRPQLSGQPRERAGSLAHPAVVGAGVGMGVLGAATGGLLLIARRRRARKEEHQGTVTP